MVEHVALGIFVLLFIGEAAASYRVGRESIFWKRRATQAELALDKAFRYERERRAGSVNVPPSSG